MALTSEATEQYHDEGYPNLLHGAATNRSDRSRYSTAWHYIPADLDLEPFPFGAYEDRHLIN